MRARQHLPERWLFTDERLGDVTKLASRLERGTGMIVRHHELSAGERRLLLQALRRIAARRRLHLADERAGTVARVHDSRELRRALTRKVDLIFLSPVYPTQTHPEQPALPRMRAAALARLAARRGYALGGMNERCFGRVRALGFAGWGGIDAFVRR